VAPSLTRGWICNLLLLLAFGTTVPLESESRGTQDHTLLSQFLRLSKSGGLGPHIYIPQEQGGPVIPLGTGFASRRHLRLAGLQWRRLLYDWRSVNMSWYQAPLWDLRPEITSCQNVAVWNLRSCFCGQPSLTDVFSMILSSLYNSEEDQSRHRSQQFLYYCVYWLPRKCNEQAVA
jgi:hypothetical protein